VNHNAIYNLGASLPCAWIHHLVPSFIKTLL